ncbi:zinc finger CCCH domain-containing protein 54 [Ziziphus jujuba]|uniref:Zinc finger CCCH domain-containing protein 54 n=1 Tax=Ziziphus jujuba TaxID=326968 RepID=A0A6P3ZHJ8_ZIZJJ|nr:zinc finger CCCH domain-containing protein 54 [Ziziphus jujuba]
MFNGANPAPGYYQCLTNQKQQFSGIASEEHNDRCMDEAIYGSDEFRMYAYKIKRCPRARSHDWTECPYAHKGEKAQRRDPRKYNYCAVVCPAYRTGYCHKGELCEFAHGVFEYWLHPARYRTRACNAGMLCQRKVCFFAHSPDQLRPEIKFKNYCRNHHMVVDGLSNQGIVVNRIPTMVMTTISSGAGATSSHQQPQLPQLQQEEMKIIRDDDDDDGDDSFDKFAEFLKTLKALKISEDDEEEKKSETSDLELPHIKWISELVQ